MSVADKVKTLLKSLAGGEGNQDDPENEDQDQEPEGAEGEGMEKSVSMLDATEILNELVSELKDMNKSLKTLIDKQETLEKSQSDVGDAIVGVAELVSKIANSPAPLKAAMAKGDLGEAAPGAGGGGAFPSRVQPEGVPTRAEFEKAQEILTKAVNAEEINMWRSEIIASDLQKAMAIPGYKMKPENYDFIARKMSA